MPAKFYEKDIKSGLGEKRKLSAYIDTLIRRHIPGVRSEHINYIFCNDEYLHKINKEFLSHDSYTDIITFDLSEKPKELKAEIYISIDRVKENAEKFITTYEEELHRVIFHGALHLCGFGDKKDADKKEMRRQEYLCLKEYFKGNS